MSKMGKSNHQMLTLAMAEFSLVDLGSMTASSYIYSTGTYIGDIVHSAVTDIGFVTSGSTLFIHVALRPRLVEYM